SRRVSGAVLPRLPVHAALVGEGQERRHENGAHHGHPGGRLEQPLHPARGRGSAARDEAIAPGEVEGDWIAERVGGEVGAHPWASSSAARASRGKKRMSRSSTSGSASQGTSSRMRVAARGSGPPRPPTHTCTPRTLLLYTL